MNLLSEWRVVSAVVALVISMLTSATVASATEHRLEAGGSFEAFPEGARGGHGSVVVGWSWRNANARWSSRVLLDTDSLEARVDHRIDPRSFWWFEAKGHAAAASLLTDAYDDLALVSGAGFAARTIGARFGTGRDLAGPWTWRIAAGARHWWFDPIADTDDSSRLLPDGLTADTHTSMTHWQLQPDAWFDTRVVRHPRLHGSAWTLSLDTSTVVPSSDSRSHGVVDDPGHDRPIGTASTSFDLRTRWLAGGYLGFIRGQLIADAGMFWNPDERHLPQTGGLHHAYVVPVAGLPWGAVRPTRHALVEGSLHLPVGDRHEVGAAIDAGWANGAGTGRVVRSARADDPLRSLLGIALFGDLRWATGWVAGIRAGYAPPFAWHEASPNVSAMVSVGWTGRVGTTARY